ncbi:MAG: hypothetical protein KBD24_03605 [Candidatus Pacebacteria bacterium]|nr:hypothetical protein [Candidatus Paceibacterota bacterium]
MTMRTFMQFCVSLFFLCATGLIIATSFLVYTQWQTIWTRGFTDFRSISTSIASLERTTLPVSVMAPDMLEQMHAILEQMKAMNDSVHGMERSVATMTVAVQGLEYSVRGMSYTVPHGMGEMRKQMNPMQMMNPFSR